MVLCSLQDTTKLPETQNQDASEVNQLAISPKDSPHSRNISEGTVLLSRKLLCVSAVGRVEGDVTEVSVSNGCVRTSCYTEDGSVSGALAAL